MLVDDHGVLLSGIKLMIMNYNQWEIVGTASTGEDAVKMQSAYRPDLILMDLSLPGIDGIEATKRIKQDNPSVKILILTMHSEEDYLKRALQAGASGYVLKKAVDTELISAIESVLRGENYIYPSLSGVLFRDLFQEHSPKKEVALSTRELEVLKYIAQGFTHQEIAEKLFVSVKTIETHKGRLSEKLGTKKRSELVRYAVKVGLIKL